MKENSHRSSVRQYHSTMQTRTSIDTIVGLLRAAATNGYIINKQKFLHSEIKCIDNHAMETMTEYARGTRRRPIASYRRIYYANRIKSNATLNSKT